MVNRYIALLAVALIGAAAGLAWHLADYARPVAADGRTDTVYIKAVTSGERGKFRIRALECRSTRCALEVVSEVETIGIAFDSDPAFNALMWPGIGTFAHEDDPQTGIRTIVSVQTWQTSESAFAQRRGELE